MHFGIILGTFSRLGGSLAPCRDCVGNLSGSWVVLGSVLVSFWTRVWFHFSMIFLLIFTSMFYILFDLFFYNAGCISDQTINDFLLMF